MYPIHFGGDVGDRTRVHNAFATKELQQYRYYTTYLFIGHSVFNSTSSFLIQYLDANDNKKVLQKHSDLFGVPME